MVPIKTQLIKTLKVFCVFVVFSVTFSVFVTVVGSTLVSLLQAMMAAMSVAEQCKIALGLGQIDVIHEEDEEEEEEDEDEEFDEKQPAVAATASSSSSSASASISSSSALTITLEQYPQAFSHFSFDKSERKLLVCDLQGVLDQSKRPPVFELTDPVIHSNFRQRKHKYGRTDHGRDGIKKFFSTHQCNDLCKLLGLSDVRERSRTRSRTRGHRAGAGSAGSAGHGQAK